MFTGEAGVCMATSGPGAVHLLNGLRDAKMDHQPVVAIVGQQKRISLGALYQQEIDLDHLFAAARARAELIETAGLLGAGVAKTLLGREALPDGLPFVGTTKSSPAGTSKWSRE